MKTKQNHIKAKFVAQNEAAKNYSGDKELVSLYKIICKKTELVVVDCRCWMSRGRNVSNFYASIWINTKTGFYSGTGSAGGWGYDKESSAIASAIESAGVELFGAPYPQSGELVDFKKRARISGTGCHKEALMAIAYAAGYRDCIVVCA